eukprot:9716616-Alexandrium_andersonii.AAC.1
MCIRDSPNPQSASVASPQVREPGTARGQDQPRNWPPTLARGAVCAAPLRLRTRRVAAGRPRTARCSRGPRAPALIAFRPPGRSRRRCRCTPGNC